MMNIKINLDLNELLGTVILKVLEYNNIHLSPTEMEKMAKDILEDKMVIDAMSNLGK